MLDQFPRRPADALSPQIANLDEAFAFPSGGAQEDFGILERVREAIVSERIDLYLQPMVHLPDRKAHCYEAFSRLRDARGRVLKPVVYIEAAERANRIGVIDNLILTRCIDAVRRYERRNEDLLVFLNVSPATLFDSAFFARFTEYLEANEDLAERLVFEFTFPSMHMTHPRVEANLAAIARRGFAFSVDHVHTFTVDWDALAARNFRYAKIPAHTLRHARGDGAGGAAGVREVLRKTRSVGINLIAEKIESDADCEEMVALGVRFGQGHLFGAPRRADRYLETGPGAPAERPSDRQRA